MEYWQKQSKPLFEKIFWNLPEQKTGIITVIGGNLQNFSTEIRNTEFLNELNLKEVKLILPDSVKSKLPPFVNLEFVPSTSSGSFDKSFLLDNLLQNSGYLLYSGDFSKNAATAIAIADTIKNTTLPCLITRDTIDLMSSELSSILEKPNLILLGSLVQLQKAFRAIYYPKMILLSMPILPVIEILHKFTLSYPTTILTFHQDQIITAKDGNVITTPINLTNFSPLSLWSGTLACKAATLHLWNQNLPLEALTSSILWDHRKASPF